MARIIISFFLSSALFYLQYCIMACLAMSRANITTDQSALLFLKTSIMSDPYRVLAENWTTTNSVCDWIGVTCNSRHNRIVALNISYMDLTGVVPQQLGNLSFLSILDLSHNNFHGNLPDGMVHLRRLRVMELASNNFTGEIPSWFAFLPKLQVLGLADNQFTGLVPSTLYNISELQILDLSNNSLQGKIQDGMCHGLPRLKGLYLSRNEFHGQIPSNLSDCLQLVKVYLVWNNFEGSIPKDIGKLQKLDTLRLDKNSLRGEIPQEIGNLRNLTILYAADNHIEGSLPRTIMNMSSLQNIGMENNRLSGAIPRVVGNLTSLKVFALSDNKFTGSIPQEVTNLKKLERVYLDRSGLSGLIPDGFFNISTLKTVTAHSNHLSGNLALSLAYGLPNLEELNLAENELTGFIPQSISNASKLTKLILAYNELGGSIPDSLGDLRFLQELEIFGNNLTSGYSPSRELSFITSLTKCKYLTYVQVSDNQLRGILPKSLGNFSSSLQYLYSYRCGIYGKIPDEIGNLSGLSVLSIFGNDLTGLIPATIQGLQQLQQLDLSVNRLRGPLSNSLCELKNLGDLYLFENQFSGPILDCFGNLTSLISIHLAANRLSSSLPSSLWNLKDLLHLNLYTNSLSGGLAPEIENLKAAIVMDLSENQFSGDIPNSIGALLNLINFSLAHNKFQGQIPVSVGGMLSLVSVDLSHNNLTGVIPKSLEKLQYLALFDVSYNSLTGEIPSNGPFKNFTSQSFLFNNNEALCGAPKFHVPPCQASSVQRSKTKKLLRVILLALGITVVALVLVVGFILLIFRRKYYIRKGADDGLLQLNLVERISYYVLLRATDGFNESNILGAGSSAAVYRGTLDDGIDVAIKVFKLQQEWSFKSFDTECKILRDLRHRNLTKVLSCCSNPDFKALVLEYMPNGSLEKWLHTPNCFLDIMHRLNIMIDVACALEYLHYGGQMSVVHCDLKPSNVLLDEDMVAHVADFGIAKLLFHNDSTTYTKTLATLGYIAPEYGLEGLVSTSSDVYSYGIMLIETFTRTRPNAEMFSENVSLRSWVKDALPGGVIQVVDANLFGPDEEHLSEKVKCLLSIMELALSCCAESPMERMSMKDVVVSLKKIKLQLPDHISLGEKNARAARSKKSVN